jgi:IS1 family transposase
LGENQIQHLLGRGSSIFFPCSGLIFSTEVVRPSFAYILQNEMQLAKWELGIADQKHLNTGRCYRNLRLFFRLGGIHLNLHHPDLLQDSPGAYLSGIGLNLHLFDLPLHGSERLGTGEGGVFSLFSNRPQSEPSQNCIRYRDVYDDPFRSSPAWQGILCGCILLPAGFFLGAWVQDRRVDGNVRWWHYCCGLAGYILSCMGATLLLFGHAWPPKQECSVYGDNRQPFQHNSVIVPQKHLDSVMFSGYSNYMANVLNTDKQIAVIGALAEGSSIRSIERITGIHRDTIMRLGVRIGQGCTALMDAKMQNLPCQRLEMDEIWGFVGKKAKSVQKGDKQVGDVWTWCCIDAETKLVPTFLVGDRSQAAADAFVADVASRMAYRVQVSTDSFYAYKEAMRKSFGPAVDYGKIIKVYGTHEFGERRYSTSGVLSSEKKIMWGQPNPDLISTSYVERLNATTRLHMRRLTRLTLAFSKKRENFEAAVGLHFGYYNFVKRHNTLKCTPAMAAGVADSQWSIGDLVEATA